MGERNRSGRDRGDQREFGGSSERRYGQDQPWREEQRQRYSGEGYGERRDVSDDRGRQDFGGRGWQGGGPEGYGEEHSRSWGHGYAYGGDSADYRPERQSTHRGANDWARADDRGWSGRNMPGDPGSWDQGRPPGYGNDYRGRDADGGASFGFGSADWNANRQNFSGRGPKDYRRSDDRIKEDICEAFTADPMLDASEVVVAVEGAEVTLSGAVDDRGQKRRAEDLADHVSGVRDVNNQLRVSRNQNTGTTGDTTSSNQQTQQQGSTRSGRGSSAPQQPSVAHDREK